MPIVKLSEPALSGSLGDISSGSCIIVSKSPRTADLTVSTVGTTSFVLVPIRPDPCSV